MAPSYVSLFTGAGGLDLGLEMADWEPLWFCENAKACQKVLAEHWPNVPVHGDVTELAFQEEEVGSPDLLVGGFPCQDLSFAGKRAGLEGDRSVLWFEMARLIRELQPRMVLAENVPGLMRAMAGGSGIAPIGVVLADLAELGYDARWGRLRAADVGAPHIRSRVFIIAWRRVLADTIRERQDGRGGVGTAAQSGSWRASAGGPAASVADSGGGGGARDSGAAPRPQEEGGRIRAPRGDVARDPREDDADSDSGGREGVGKPQPGGLEGQGWHEPDGPGAAGEFEDAEAAEAADTGGEGRQGAGHRAGGRQGAAGSDPSLTDASRERFESGRGRGTEGGVGTRAGQAQRDGDRHNGPSEQGPHAEAADADGAYLDEGQGRRGALQGAKVTGEPALQSGGRARSGEGEFTVDWGIYAPAIERWSRLTRPAPGPTDALGRLSPRFSEWMLGFPEDWVNVEGISRTAQLRMLGNACQVQCAEAIGWYLRELEEHLA